MPAPLVSRPTLRQLADTLSDWWVLRTIEHLFEDAGVALGPPEADGGESGQRRALTWRYLSTLDLTRPTDAARLLRVMEQVLTQLNHEEGQAARDKLLTYLRRDGVELTAGGRLRTSRDRVTDRVRLDNIDDPVVLEEHLTRIERDVDTDPAGAISAAKSLIESTLKITLTQLGETYSRSAKFTQLVEATHTALGLKIGTLAPDKAGDSTLRQILDGLRKIAVGVDELRNRYGRDHGQAERAYRLDQRHAHLAVGTATTYCRFLLDTIDDPAAPWRQQQDGFERRD